MTDHSTSDSADKTAQSSDEWLAELNPDQRRAVTHGDGPLLIVAGAGSGKTKTLAYRVAYLISQGVAPERILLLTFTRRASEEMIKRATAVIEKGKSIGKVWGGTFHSIANRLLRIYSQAAGLDNAFTVMDQSDAEDLINVIRHDLGLHTRDKRFPRKGTCLAIYSRCVNGTDSLVDVLRRHFPWCQDWETELKELFRRYVDRKQERNILDYDDLLLYWSELLTDESVANVVGGRFDHVLVDEYQDTNKLQAGILQGMRRLNKNITVVGDDAQSIYSFRAATVRNMLDFPKQFPGATVVTLEQNYRSVMPILEATNRVIAQSTERYSKDLWSGRTEGQKPKLVTCKDEATQDKFIIDAVLEHYEQGIPLRKQAVLFRAAHLSDSLEVELARRNVPFHKYGGLRFLEAAHVKDLVSILRIAENPRDEIAWYRILQLMDGIGPSLASKIVQHVANRGHDPLAIRTFDVPSSARLQITQFAAMLEDVLSSSLNMTPQAQIERVRKFYDPLLKKIYENPSVRMKDIENLEGIAAGYKSRSRFLTDIQLDPPTSTSDLAGPPLKDEDWLVLSTIHSAKGCEWDVVYLMHAADGWLPSDMSTGSKEELEEELRLTYVAMTRARDFLYVTWPLRYYHKRYALGDGHSYAQLCRFITDWVKETLDPVQVGETEEADAAAGTESRRDIAARIRSRWD